MKRYLFDTNAFLRYILHDVVEQSDIVGKLFILAKRKECEITMPLVVFFETTYILTAMYKLPKNEVIQQLAAFLQTPYIHIPDRVVLQRGYALWGRYAGISFADAVLFEMAKSEGKELITFDKKLKKLATD